MTLRVATRRAALYPAVAGAAGGGEWWNIGTCYAAYDFLTSGTVDQSGNGYTIDTTNQGTMSWASGTGWTISTSAGNISTTYTLTNSTYWAGSMMIRISGLNDPNTTRALLFGHDNAFGNGFGIVPDAVSTNGIRIYNYGAVNDTTTSPITTGTLGLSDQSLYVDGVDTTTDATTSSQDFSAAEVLIGNIVGTAISGVVVAFWIGSTLSSGDMATLHSNMMALT